MRSTCIMAFCFLGTPAALAAQQVWKVHNGTLPGAHFTDLPQAVAAAAPNDLILVYHGGGGGTFYTAATIDKPLVIMGFSVMPPGPSGEEPLPAIFGGLFTVTGIPFGQRVVIANCNVSQIMPSPPPPAGIHISGCGGEVILEGFHFLSYGLTNSTLRIENSDNVVLRGCEFLLGGSPIDVTNSRVLITTTRIEHTNPTGYPTPPFPGFPIFTQTADGMRVTDSDVTIVNSLVRGSQAISGYGPGYGARKGVQLVSGTVTVGPGASLRGGALLSGGETSGYSIADPTTGFVYKDTRGNIPFPWPPVPPLATTLHTMLHAWPIAGDIALFDIWGPPGGFALVVFGDRLPAPVPTPLGELWFDPAAAEPVDLVALQGATGEYSWVRSLPLTAPVGYPFVLQALTLDPVGTLALTVPSPFTVAYPYWIAP